MGCRDRGPRLSPYRGRLDQQVGSPKKRMRIVLYADNTIPVALEPLSNLLTRTCASAEFVVGAETFHLGSAVTCPATHRSLSKKLKAEVAKHDLAILCTAVPYENNFFFEADGHLVIISFAGWHLLTRLPISNGIAYFVASIIADIGGIGSTHDENTGCLNDFFWDKAGIDVAMRAAFVCADCAGRFEGDPDVLESVRRLLDLVSSASRQEKDILSVTARTPEPTRFDVFLCHNSQDKPAVRDINTKLKSSGVRTWLDEEQLPLGTPWQPELENRISDVSAACVFVGASGLGPWQNAEIRGFLSEFMARACPVIPVLLPNAPAVPDLPIFLRQMTWLDLRQEPERGLGRLVEALKHPPHPVPTSTSTKPDEPAHIRSREPRSRLTERGLKKK